MGTGRKSRSVPIYSGKRVLETACWWRCHDFPSLDNERLHKYAAFARRHWGAKDLALRESRWNSTRLFSAVRPGL